MDNTPYDDVFRTLLTDCTELMIPVVNEIFHTKYTGEETVCLLQNEHFIKMPDGRNGILHEGKTERKGKRSTSCQPQCGTAQAVSYRMPEYGRRQYDNPYV